MNIEKKAWELTIDALTEKGFKLMNVSYVKENNNYFLRFVIDKDEVVNIDDCMEATKIINNILDKQDIIKDKYILDVCSYERGGK